jgi:hypothetical protein
MNPLWDWLDPPGRPRKSRAEARRLVALFDEAPDPAWRAARRRDRLRTLQAAAGLAAAAATVLALAVPNLARCR